MLEASALGAQVDYVARACRAPRQLGAETEYLFALSPWGQRIRIGDLSMLEIRRAYVQVDYVARACRAHRQLGAEAEYEFALSPRGTMVWFRVCACSRTAARVRRWTTWRAPAARTGSWALKRSMSLRSAQTRSAECRRAFGTTRAACSAGMSCRHQGHHRVLNATEAHTQCCQWHLLIVIEHMPLFPVSCVSV